MLSALGAVLPVTAAATFPGSTGQLSIGPNISDGLDTVAPKPFPSPFGGKPVYESRWSPDGTRLAFMSSNSSGGNRAMFVVNADGTNMTQVTTPGSEFHDGLAWSPDGSQIAYTSLFGCGEASCSELRIAPATGGNGTAIVSKQNVRFIGPDWSPDPDNFQIAVESSSHSPGNGTQSRLVLVGGSGGEREIAGPSPKYFGESYAGRSMSWSPDGKKLAWAPRNGDRLLLFDQDGNATGSLKPSTSGRVFGATFTPDGGRILTGSCTGGDSVIARCKPVLMRVDDPRFQFNPEEPAETAVSDREYLSDSFTPDFQPADHPIIFIHGYAGSELACGGDVKWFGRLPDVDELILAADGDSPAAGQCAAEPTKALRKAAGLDIYGSTFKALEEMAPGRVHDFAWDWRRDPRVQLDKLRQMITTALSDELSKKQALDEVVLVGHSFGGLFIRAALDEEDINQQVRRVLTIGTPYHGAPKAIFPLCCGVETPGFSGLDVVLDNDDMQAFAENNTGNYWLYPSTPYGAWLSWNGRDPVAGAEAAGLVKLLGGSTAAFARAVDGHAKFDGFKQLEPRGLREVRAVVGTGLATISSVEFRKGLEETIVGFASGDGTVPARSGSQGEIGAKPMGDPVPVNYVCKVKHVPLPGDKQVIDAYKDYIRYGTPPLETRRCDVDGQAYELYDVDVIAGGGASASASGKALDVLEKADRAGRLDVVELGPRRLLVVVDATGPFSVKVPLDGMSITAYPITEAGKGKAVNFPPLSGMATLEGAPGASPVVKLGGKTPPKGRLKLRVKKREAGFQATCPKKCSLLARLMTPKGKLVGRAKGRGRVTLKLPGRRRGKVTLVVEATDKQGRFASVSRRLTLR